jgi:hypothetical protein
LYSIIGILIKHAILVPLIAARLVVISQLHLILNHLKLYILSSVSLSATELAEASRIVQWVLLIAAGRRRRVPSDSANAKLSICERKKIKWLEKVKLAKYFDLKKHSPRDKIG